MAKEKKNAEKKVSKIGKDSKSCEDNLCPIHGSRPLRIRGRVFEGKVVKKLHGRLTILFERTLYVRKYERYEKRKTKLHARLPTCMEDEINVGDYIQIAECRPVSKLIHFVVVKKIRGKTIKEGKQ